MSKSIILGIYETKGSEELQLTQSTEKYNAQVSGRLVELIKSSGPSIKQGKSREFFGIDKEYACVSVACLGAPNLGYNELEEIEEKRENIRAAIGGATKKLRELEPSIILVDDCGDAEAAAEGACLSLHSYDDLKKEKKSQPQLQLLNDKASAVSWQNGLIKASAQKLAARLMEMPANHLTPTKFAETADQILSSKGISVTKRDRSWAESKGMGSFLSVSRGSDEPPAFLELVFKGREEGAKPLVLVGKGITFDSGGISLKPSASMDEMRADMGGAACIVGTFQALAELKPPINVVGLIPLCENMPSGKATKPGDVVTAMNGKTIQVDNTDAEGRLILADALCYAHEFNPMAILDLATLTGAMIVALGSSATGVFTNSSKMWMILHQAGMGTGDRVWRMPLWKHYTKAMTDAPLADLNNISSSGTKGGGSCTAAAFLREFVTHDHWLHLDIAGVMKHGDEYPYLAKGMAGRPTRTLVEFVHRLSQYGH